MHVCSNTIFFKAIVCDFEISVYIKAFVGNNVGFCNLVIVNGDLGFCDSS